MIKNIKNTNKGNTDWITITFDTNRIGLNSLTVHFAEFIKIHAQHYTEGIALTDFDIALMETFAQDYLFKTFTLEHTGKMQGKKSLTISSCKCNEFCLKMQNVSGSICEKCFADDQLTRQPSTDNKMQRNAAVWGTVIIPDEFLPIIPYKDFRIDSFGEFRNDIDVYNVMALAKKNPHCKIRVWTKRPDLLQRYCDKYGKPLNCWFIYSSPFINDQNLRILKLYPCIDAIFTVFDDEYIKEHNININCGGLHCVGCTGGRCYDDNPETIVNERLK